MKIYIAADHRGHEYKLELIRKLREKNYDANVLALGSDFTPVDQALTFIETMVQSKPSTEERMLRRVGKIESLRP